MVNNNNLITQIENKKPVELVQEAYSEVPSYEEFMRNYNKSKGVVDSYSSEVDSYGDIRIRGTYYGPGFWDDIKGVVKPIATGALVVASVFPPTAAVAAPVAFGVVGTGAAAMGLGHLADDKNMKELGKDLIEIGSGAREGQEITESPMVVKGRSPNEYARSR